MSAYDSNTVTEQRSAFGWPPGSIRALITLMIVGMLCAHLLIPTQEPIPGYLIYLLLLILGSYFAARSHQPADYKGRHPLFLPRGAVRFLIFVALVGTIGYKLATDADGLERLFKTSVLTMQQYPELPLVLLIGFFVGVFLRVVIFRGKPPAFWQDIEAWIALIALVGLGAAAIMQLIVNPSLAKPLEMHGYVGFLTGVIAFYFGAR